MAKSAVFYSALGWERSKSPMDDIVWFRTPHSYVGLLGYEALAEDAAAHAPAGVTAIAAARFESVHYASP